MKKIFIFLLLLTFGVAYASTVANTEGKWKTVKISEKNQSCDSVKHFYHSEGAIGNSGLDDAMILCLHENDENQAEWLLSYSNNNAVLGRKCQFTSDGWACKQQQRIKRKTIDVDFGEFENMFDEDKIFNQGRGRFWLKE
ncbi:MAG: hypothetical protein IK065_04570 [Neisseriaceae bacterium]|nr:hypothetical protein [Neisseriaceae bacterium]